MDQILNFMDMGFIITLGILILVCGAIMLYSYRRLNLLENSIIEHGKILQNFIINYNNQMLNNNVYNRINNDENNNLKNINIENNKIIISDNESDEDEDDDDNEDDNDDNDDNENNEDNEDNDDPDEAIDSQDDSDDDSDDSDDDDEDDDDKDENNDNNGVNDTVNSEFEKKNILELLDSDNEKENKDIDLNIDEESLIKSINIKDISSNDELVFELNQMDINVGSKLINLENNNDNVDEKKNYSKMKVDDLRTLVVSKSLIDNESSKNMKKNDLIKLLQEN